MGGRIDDLLSNQEILDGFGVDTEPRSGLVGE
jgi:hypothetical protein